MAPLRQISLSAILTVSLLISTRAAVVPGHVEGWGKNISGQATPPAGLDGIIAIAAGSDHSLALRTNGTVVAWGNNAHGQCNVPAGLNDAMAIAAGLHSVALRSNGTVVVWGSVDPLVTTIPAGLANVTAIAARGYGGDSYTIALKQDGTVVSWGYGNFSQTNVPAGLNGVNRIAAGYTHGLALKTDGTIVGWGYDSFGSTSHPAGLANVVRVNAGQYVTGAVRSDGTGFSWGEPSLVSLPAGLQNVVDVQFGFTSGYALRNDGSVVPWGTINDGFMTLNAQIPSGISGVTSIAVGDNFTLFLTARPLVTGITPPIKTTVGTPVMLSVTATGVDPHYQWKRNGIDLPERTEATLAIANVQPSDAGTYMVRVSNPHGFFDSPNTTISFDPPLIQNAPTNLIVYRGETARFSVTAQGLDPLSYEWRKLTQLIAGAVDSALSITNVRKSDAGLYRVTVRDAAGGTANSTAILTVFDPTAGSDTLSISRRAAVSLGTNPQGVTTILAGTRGNGTVDRAIIAFDLAGIPPGATIQSASLRMSVVKIPRSPSNSTFSLYRMLKPWGPGVSWLNAQTGVSWGTPGGQAGTDFSATSSAGKSVAGIANYDFASTQFTADVQSWVNDPSRNHGWMFKSDGESVGRTARHFGTAPQLTISYSNTPDVVAIENFRAESSDLVFELDGAAGWVYRVEARPTFNDGNWATLTNAPAGAGTNRIIIRAPMNDAQQFYRVTAE